MKTSNIFFAFSASILIDSNEVTDLHKRFPYALLTTDYEILSENDIIRDISIRDRDKVDLLNPQSRFYRWQCFPTHQVKYHFHTWRDLSPYGGTDIIGLCDFGIRVRLKNESHFYYDRRARPVEYCIEMAKEWKRLTKNQPYLCLNGERGSVEKKETGWIWNKTKTKTGCISLFVGDCENL